MARASSTSSGGRHDRHARPDPATTASAIEACVGDYYEGWFEGDADRMRRAHHPELVKRGPVEPGTPIDTDTAATMVEATERGLGTRHASDQPGISISIDDVHGTIAAVHARGGVYVDYLHLVHVDDRWQIINGMWGRA